jgi:hypothetical protein
LTSFWAMLTVRLSGLAISRRELVLRDIRSQKESVMGSRFARVGIGLVGSDLPTLGYSINLHHARTHHCRQAWKLLTKLCSLCLSVTYF